MKKEEKPLTELEARIEQIIRESRKEAYSIIKEEMYDCFMRIGECLKEFYDSDQKERHREFLHIMSKRENFGLSFETLAIIWESYKSENTLDKMLSEKFFSCLVEYLKARTLTFEATREKYPNYLKPWTKEDDEELEDLIFEGVKPEEIARKMGRNPGAINARIEKLRLNLE